MISRSFLTIYFVCTSMSVISASELAAESFEVQEKLPTAIPTCKLNDIDIDECLHNAFQHMASRLKIGLPELNIPSLDPFVVEKISFQFDEGIIRGRIFLKNIHIYGLSDVIIDKVHFQLRDGHMTMEHIAHIPNLYVEGSYKADVKLNEVKMMPKGYFNITLTDVTIKSHPEGDIYVGSDGHSYMKLTKFDIDPDVGDLRVYANGIFSDPTLNAVMLNFVNQYWRLIYKSIIPSARATWEPIMINSANEFLATLPIDSLLTSD